MFTINRLLALAAILFGLTLLMLLGRLAEILTHYPPSRWINLWSGGQFRADPQDFQSFAAIALRYALLGFVLALFIDRCVNLNWFSLHALYRNRLIRAFLGSARRNPPPPQSVTGNPWSIKGNLLAKLLSVITFFLKNTFGVKAPPGSKSLDENYGVLRSADPFTGFAPWDNIRLAEVWPGRSSQRLFPVINVTLNRTTGKDTARAQRKGEPFTMTPLRCGAAGLRQAGAPPHDGAYAITAKYAAGEQDMGPNDPKNGITLSTAMTISGAAVSPNMGYSSSRFTAFLMTLFNVRLGAWLPNPGMASPKPRSLRRSDPKFAMHWLLKELIGQSDAEDRYVYLSDGGHFDNLGLYEMLRRRCANILVVDAGRDSSYAYTDLGHTLQSALIDLGVQVEFVTQIKTADKQIVDGFHFANVYYPASGDHPECKGKLIYLKPYLPATLPVELQAYHELRPEFPNEPTSNQFFTESDF